jgi:hypothetical protein
MGAKKALTAPSPSLTSPKHQNLSTTSNAIKATKKEKVPAADAKSGAKEATKKSEIGSKIATSIRKASTKPVLNNNAVKKSQTTSAAAESKKSISRDNSSDKSIKKPIVNSKSKAEKKIENNLNNHDKCNKVEKSPMTKSNSENSIKKSAEKESDKIKSMTSDSKHSSNHTNPPKKGKIKISNELKNLAIDGIQKEISSGLKTSICEMVKLKKARHSPEGGSAKASANKNKLKESQDSKSLMKKVPEHKESLVNKSSSDETLKSEIKANADQKNINGTNFKVIKAASEINESAVAAVVTAVKRKYVKKSDVNLLDKSKVKDEDKKSQPKVSTTKEQSDAKKNISPPSTPLKKPKTQSEAKVTGSGKANNKIISATTTAPKEKQKNNNQSSAKSKASNAEAKVLSAKTNESKVGATKNSDNQRTKVTATTKKAKAEQAINSKINVAITKKLTPAGKTSKNKVAEKDPLKLSSSSSEEENSSDSENERESDNVFKKPTKPATKAKPTVRAVKIVKKITSIKKCRVASLNAIAKVHCLYENEARVHLDHLTSNVAKVVKKPIVASVCNVSSDEDDDDNDEEEDIKCAR